MLATDHPTLRYVSPRTRMRKTNYTAQAFAVSLRAFADQREGLLRILRPLKIEEWSRGATFTGTVRGREATVLIYAQRIADHEAQHLEQMASVLETI